MGTHQDRKSEIDAKADKFKTVEQTANELIEKDHYASLEIKDRIDNLTQQRNILDDEWDLHWEEMQMSKLRDQIKNETWLKDSFHRSD